MNEWFSTEIGIKNNDMCTCNADCESLKLICFGLLKIIGNGYIN